MGENTKSLKRKSDELKKILENEKISKANEAKVYRDSLKVNTKELEKQAKCNDYKEKLEEELEERLKGDEK